MFFTHFHVTPHFLHPNGEAHPDANSTLTVEGSDAPTALRNLADLLEENETPIPIGMTITPACSVTDYMAYVNLAIDPIPDSAEELMAQEGNAEDRMRRQVNDLHREVRSANPERADELDEIRRAMGLPTLAEDEEAGY